MRFTATALATIVAVLVIGGTQAPLSGQSGVPPCELAPQVPTTPAPLPAPSAPSNLRILGGGGGGGLEELVEDLFVSGPNAGPDADYEPSTTTQATNPHAYYFSLASRSDCIAAYSLRDAAQIQQYRAPSTAVKDYDYLYPNDPFPQQQDAMKIRVRPSHKGTDGQIRLPLNSAGQSFLLVFDFWMDDDWRKGFSKLDLHKIAPFIFRRAGDHQTFGMQIDYTAATQSPGNQPAGGPFVAMPYPHVNDGSMVKRPAWWRDTDVGFPRAKLPYGASTQRTYGEAIQPFDTSVTSAGAEFGLVANRWHRIWHYVERVPSQDWGSMAAYAWTVWFADTVRNPVKLVDGAILGLPQTSNALVRADIGFGAGNSNLPAEGVVRGDLVAYSRNWVVLRGLTKATALSLLQKPQ